MEHDVIDAEVTAIQAADAAPHFAITPAEAARRFDEFKQFVHSQMIVNEDYGVIPGTGSKPSLLKPGAEKLANLFGLAIDYTRTEYSSDREFVEFAYRCTLTSRKTGCVVATCEAFCNSEEKRSWGDAPMKFKNTIAKMAQKRALVGAVLHATRASGMFTQDVEDMGEYITKQPAKPQQDAKNDDDPAYKCANPLCGKEQAGFTNPKTKRYVSAKWLGDKIAGECGGYRLCSDCAKLYKSGDLHIEAEPADAFENE